MEGVLRGVIFRGCLWGGGVKVFSVGFVGVLPWRWLGAERRRKCFFGYRQVSAKRAKNRKKQWFWADRLQRWVAGD